MNRAVCLLLVLILASTPSGAAQLGRRPVDGGIPRVFTPAGSCDPAGNVDEIPFDASSVPLEDWLKEREARQIPMEITVREPELRMDQQLAASYIGKIHLKGHKTEGDRKVVFFVGVDSTDGKRLTETSVHAVNVPPDFGGDVDIAVLGCVYFQPGSYSLWIAAYDESTMRHSVRRQHVRISAIKNDPLPLLDSQNPPARFPNYTPEETFLEKVIPTSLFLPVSNKRPLDVEIISLSPYQRNVIGPLSQMALKDGSIHVTTLDLSTQKVVYDSRTHGTFDFTEMLKAADQHKEDQTIDFSVLINDDSAGYLRKFIEQRLKGSNGKPRVLFVVSSRVDFPRGADTSAIAVDENCECRLFHIQMPSPIGRDDLVRILTSPQTRRLEVTTALEFRKLLGSIVRDLDAI